MFPRENLDGHTSLRIQEGTGKSTSVLHETELMAAGSFTFGRERRTEEENIKRWLLNLNRHWPEWGHLLRFSFLFWKELYSVACVEVIYSHNQKEDLLVVDK